MMRCIKYKYVILISILVFCVSSLLLTSLSFAQSCFWVGVERAGINSHQLRDWCPNGTFLVGFDLDGNRSLSSHDAPIVGQAMCCSAHDGNYRWGDIIEVDVQRGGINSHQLNRWCPDGTFLVGLDLDGDTRYSPYDAPVVGRAMCASLRGYDTGGSCYTIDVERGNINSHQPLRWCPDGTFLVGLDLDGDRRYSPYDAPVVGRAMCCSLGGD